MATGTTAQKLTETSAKKEHENSRAPFCVRKYKETEPVPEAVGIFQRQEETRSPGSIQQRFSVDVPC